MMVQPPDHSAPADPRPVPRSVTCLLYAGVAGVFIWILILVNIRITHGHSGDFRHFYYAARAMRFGQNPYAEGTGALDPSVWVTKDESRASTGGYLYPPLIAFLYLPVSGLTPHTAERVVLVVNMICCIAGLLIACRVFVERIGTSSPGTPVKGRGEGDFANHKRSPSGRHPDPLPGCRERGPEGLLAAVTLIALLLDVDKVRGELQMFQTNSLMFLMFAVSLKWLDRRPWLAGVPLGVILDIKYLSVATIPWLIVRRRYKTAAAAVAGAVAFALLPAVATGWQNNLHHLRIAYGGLATMMGVGEKTADATSQANVEDIKNWLSVSITSAAARMSYFCAGAFDWQMTPAAVEGVGLAAAAAIMAITVALVIWLYRRSRVPLLLWPPASLQTTTPWRQTICYEFTSVLIATLCFSPQTNTRHLLLVLLMTAPMAVLIMTARPKPRGVAMAVAAGFMAFSFVWPGGEQIDGKHRLALMWAGVGAPAWGMLAGMLTMISVGLSQLTHLAPHVLVRGSATPQPPDGFVRG
jgi:hypothetical protein